MFKLRSAGVICVCVLLLLAGSGVLYGATVIYADSQSPGWNATDATACLQNAINACAAGDTVIVKDMNSPWYVTPITISKSAITIQFEKGVVVMAKKGSFIGTSDSLFSARGQTGVKLIGYGATLRMRKTDYLDRSKYKFGEWRMGIQFAGCSNSSIEGLTIADTGGDGIYIAGNLNAPCSSITIKDVTCDNNYRQGMSVITVDGLTVTNCVFKNTSGTAPAAGVDFEPNHDYNLLKGIVFDNCIFQDNHGSGIEVAPGNLKNNPAQPIDITIKNSKVIGGGVVAVLVSGIDADGPTGAIKFETCTFEGSWLGAIDIMNKSKDRATVDFNSCTIKNCGRGTIPNLKDPSYTSKDGKPGSSLWYHDSRWIVSGGSLPYPSSPISFDDYGGDPALGGVTFRNCTIIDDKDRPAVKAIRLEAGLTNVSGTFRYFNAVNPNPTTDFSGYTPITDVNITFSKADSK